jgi:hypothetical protein
MYINNFMNYLTNHYRNLCEQYQSKINILQNLLNEDAPASTFSGTGKGQQTFSDEQLRDQMKQNRRTGMFGAEVADDKQNQAFKDAQAELARRQGASAKVELDPSIKQSSDYKTDRVAGDWVERYAQKLGEDPRKIEAMRRGVIDTLGGDAGKPMDTSMTSTQVAQRGVDAYNKAKEYVVNLQNQAKAAKPESASTQSTTSTQIIPNQQPVPFQGQSFEAIARQVQNEIDRQTSKESQPTGPGRKGAKPSQTVEPSEQALVQTGAPESAKQLAQLYAARMTGGDVFGRKYSKQPEPAKAEEVKIPEMEVTQKSPTKYVVPESEEWEKMFPQEQLAMAQSALKNDEANKFFGGREGKKGGFLGIGGEKTYRFSEDNSGQTPEETARLNRQAKMLNNLLNTQDAGAMSQQLSDILFKYNNNGNNSSSKSSETISTGGMNQPMDLADFPDNEDTDKQSSSAELENARKLAQMYANRMGRRYSKAPKEQVSSFDSAFKAYQDRNARTSSMPLAMAGEQSSKGSNMEGQALENDSAARARYAQSVKTNASQKAAQEEFVRRFGRLPNSKSAVDNTYMETLLSTKFKTR